jgi:hypothetical protein
MTTDNIKRVDNSHFAKDGEKAFVSKGSVEWALKQIAELDAEDIAGFVFCAHIKAKEGSSERGLEVICATLDDTYLLIEALIRKVDATVKKHAGERED